MTARKSTVTAAFSAAGLAVLVGATLVVSAIEVRVLDPDFYVRHLSRAGSFARISAAVVPVAAKAKTRTIFPDTPPELLEEIGVWARRILSPDWLERCTRRGLEAALAYIRGDRSDLTVRLPIQDRVVAVAEVLSDRLDESPLATVAYERLTAYAAHRLETEQQTLPLGITTAETVWLDAIRLVAPEAFVARHLGAGMQDLADWLVGATPHLRIHLPLEERSRFIATSLSRVVAESDISTFLRESVLVPALSTRLDERTLIPETTIEITRDELLGVIESLLGTDFVREQQAAVTAAAAAYLTSQSDVIGLTIDLRPLRLLVAERLAVFLESKVRSWLETRPACTATGVARIVLGVASPLGCEPRGRSASTYHALLTGYVREQVAAVVEERVPESWTLTTDQLRGAIPDHAWMLVENVRGWLRFGLDLDEYDLQSLLEESVGGDAGRSLLRDFLIPIREGFVLDLGAFIDLRVVERSVANGERAVKVLEAGRAAVPFAIIILVLVLASCEDLSRRWRTRLIALAVLAGATGAVVLTRLGEEFAANAVRELATVDNHSDLTLATLVELPRLAESMLGEIATAVELASQGVLVLAVLTFAASWFVRNARSEKKGLR